MGEVQIREIDFGGRCGIEWLPSAVSSWRKWRGSGYRFLQLGRVRLWVRWPYE